MDEDQIIDDSGFVPDANLPGDTQGETNGMYAGMTENTITDNGFDYFDANPGGKTDFLGGLSDTVRELAGIGRDVQNARAQNQRQNARLQYEKAHGYKPSLGDQWNGLDTFSKLGFLFAVLGVYWALKK